MSNDRVGQHGPGADPARRLVVPEMPLPPQPPPEFEEAKVSWIDVMRRIFGECLTHPHQQIGRCVYCSACSRRLYQGTLVPMADRRELQEEMDRGQAG